MKRRILYIAIIIIACFLLQSSVFPYLKVASVTPNLLVVVTASFGFMRGRKEGLFVGFFCGVILDLMFGNILGLYALIYMYIGFINGIFHRIFFPDDIKMPLILIAASDFFCNAVIYISQFLIRGSFDFGYYFLHVILPELVYTMIISIVLYFVLLKINQRLEEHEKKGALKFD